MELEILQQEIEKKAPHAIKRIIESLLFAAKEPLSLHKIKEVVSQFEPTTTQSLKAEIEALQQEFYDEVRAFQIEEIANGYILRSNPIYHPYLQILFKSKKADKLSPAALETLAIIAYKQPITKQQIEMIRGVDCSGILHALQERAFIEINGKLEVPGRPSLFVTTKEFLKYFGLRDLTDLPQQPQ